MSKCGPSLFNFRVELGMCQSFGDIERVYG